MSGRLVQHKQPADHSPDFSENPALRTLRPTPTSDALRNQCRNERDQVFVGLVFSVRGESIRETSSDRPLHQQRSLDSSSI